MRLLLVRHGESVCGVNGIVGGHKGCTGLTERGFEQVRALRDRLIREGFVPEAVLASTLPRARQTAEDIAEPLGLDVTVDPDLCEFSPGEIDGTPWEDWERFDVVAEPDRPLSPGGESLSVFKARVSGLMERLARVHDGRSVLAACHGGIVYRSIYHAFDLPDVAVSADVDHTSITEWRHEDGRWHLVRFNDVAHLAGTDLLVTS